MAVAKRKSIKKIVYKTWLPIFLSTLLIILLILTYQILMQDKFYPITLIGDQNISFLTKAQAKEKFREVFAKRSQQQITFTYPQNTFTIDLSSLSPNLGTDEIENTLTIQHNGNFLSLAKLQLQNLLFSQNLNPKVNLNLDNQASIISKQVDKEPQDATLIGREIKKGEDGLVLDKDRLKDAIANYLVSGKYQMDLPLKLLHPKITTQNVLHAKQTLENLDKEAINLKFEGNIWVLDSKQVLPLLDLTSSEDIPLDKEKINTYISKIAQSLDQDVQESLFEFNPDTKRVNVFKPSQEGRKLDQSKTYQMIVDALTGGSKNINLPVDKIEPKIQTQDVNSLGIRELIGRGISNFAGSIPNRAYNVGLTATKLNGVLIPPGETFSFNKTVGDITAATGFKQAYVIKEGRTVLDDGGGVCQDSTTLFRAVLNAGLPVIKRTAHAYRVGYYEQGFPPGLDATVFYPSVDFQFKNDTPAHILIQAYTYGTTLYIDLYGTSDGRVAYLTKPIITDQTPPPPDLRQDDPTLPKGTVKQVDFSAWGANVRFGRTVTRDGQELIKETWYSSFKPWQAVYLIGTQ